MSAVRLDFQFDDIPLDKALFELISQYQLPLGFRPEQVAAYRVHAACTHCELDEAMAVLLHGTPLNLRARGRQYLVVYDAEKVGLIRGRVSLEEEAVPFARIIARAAGRFGGGTPPSWQTRGDEQGRFAFPGMNPGVYELFIDMPDYASLYLGRVRLKPGEDRWVESTVVLPISFELEVKPHTRIHLSRERLTNGAVVLPEDFYHRPYLAGDVFRAVETLPGVAGGDLSANLHIRGGRHNEALILLDGAEIEEPFHLRTMSRGPVSLFDSEVVAELELMTGGFPIQFGDHLSGVVNSKTHDAEYTRHGFHVGLFNSRVTSQGRVGEGHYLVNVRRGYFDYSDGFTRLDPSVDSDADYFDFYAKFVQDVGPIWRLSLHTLVGESEGGLARSALPDSPFQFESVASREKNRYLWANFRGQWDSGLVFEQHINWGGWSDETAGEDQVGIRRYQVKDFRDFERVHLRQDWRYGLRGGSPLWKWGMYLKRTRGSVDYANSRTDNGSIFPLNVGTTQTKRDLEGSQWGGYFAANMLLAPKWTAEVGLRYDRQNYLDEAQVSPRCHLLYEMNPRHVFKLGWGRFYQSQGVHELEVQRGVEEYQAPEQAGHLVLSYELHMGLIGMVRLEAYEKRFSELNPRPVNYLEPLVRFPEVRADYTVLPVDSGRARGLEMWYANRSAGVLHWVLSYAWSKAYDKVAGASIDRQWDQRHSLNLALNYHAPSGWYAYANWQYHSGWPTTEVIVNERALPDGSIEIEPALGPWFASRVPEYHRLDLRLGRDFVFEGRQLNVYIECINLYDRQNVRSFDEHALVFSGDQTAIQFLSRDWLSFTPSIGLSYSF
ncbi:TonB-dependent receptor [Acanthopleuribacter pedis]|uniref:TonB-dependent receptor n=1 Tax=Acanthopleuribacter pedis TaxID=442870 RepID=A0A8J7QCK0_9BACT|nr:TonB-dependent receptor [Acanthopleuribacter pedis]MBO1323221.1 TonB-dependent receptor [Acanthopleuribacter pedis]